LAAVSYSQRSFTQLSRTIGCFGITLASVMAVSIFTNPGQGWLQLGELAFAFVLSALIGLEREYRHKSAGLRTYTVVGVGAALFMLVSKYGFSDVLQSGRVVLDPSRVAAQIVTGIGFIGGGVIFMRSHLVRGLTTAAIVWLTAAVGMACGAGLPVLAVAVTGAHFVIIFAFPALARRVPRRGAHTARLRLVYGGGQGTLRHSLEICTQRGFTIAGVGVERLGESVDDIVNATLTLRGKANPKHLVDNLREIDGSLSVHLLDPDEWADGG
jgi:putative Mg2+ transporter-C (MgtC) family protein